MFQVLSFGGPGTINSSLQSSSGSSAAEAAAARRNKLAVAVPNVIAAVNFELARDWLLCMCAPLLYKMLIVSSRKLGT